MLFAYYSNINIIILIYVVVRSKEIYQNIFSPRVSGGRSVPEAAQFSHVTRKKRQPYLSAAFVLGNVEICEKLKVR